MRWVYYLLKQLHPHPCNFVIHFPGLAFPSLLLSCPSFSCPTLSVYPAVPLKRPEIKLGIVETIRERLSYFGDVVLLEEKSYGSMSQEFCQMETEINGLTSSERTNSITGRWTGTIQK